MEIRELKENEYNLAQLLIKDTFDLFEAPIYKPEGCETFYRFLDEAICLAQLFPGSFIFLGCFEGEVMQAACAYKENHLNLLFTAAQYQGHGAGRALTLEVLRRVTAEKYKKLTVNASPIAVEFYRKLGFCALAKEQCRDGIRYVPMEMPCSMHV